MAVSLDTPSFALLNGALCKLNRRGTVTKRHKPLGTAVVEFVVVGERILVREQAEGCLLGMPNLYCLDSNLFIIWLAELPAAENAYACIREIAEEQVRCLSTKGESLRLNLSDGKVCEVVTA